MRQTPPLSRPLRWLIQSLLLLLTATVLGLGWYGYKRGLTRSWREIVFKEFRRHGIEVAFRKLTLDPFRGLVARDVTLFDTNDRRRIIANVDQVALSVDFSRLANNRPFLTALELRDAKLSLPLEANHAQGERLEVKHLSARLFFPDREVQVAQAEARVLGCRVRVQGWLANPGSLQATPTPEQGEPRWTHLAKPLLTELRSVRHGAGPPELELQFSGDFHQPSSLRASLQIRANDLALRGIPLDSATGKLVWQNAGWELQNLCLEDAQGGKLVASGRWEGNSSASDFSCESTLDPLALAKAAGWENALSDCLFRQRPTLQIQRRSDPTSSRDPLWTAQLRASGFSRANSADFEIKASASSQGSLWSIRGLELSSPSGFLKADLLRTTGPTRARLDATLSKGLLQKLLGPELLSALIELQRQPSQIAQVEVLGSLNALFEKKASPPFYPKPDWFESLLPSPTLPSP